MKRRRVAFARSAEQDVRAIGAWIRRDDPKAATQMVSRIVRRIRSLSDAAEAHPVIPDLAEGGWRKAVVAPYVIVFRIETDRVFVFRVLHGHRDVVSEVSDGAP